MMKRAEATFIVVVVGTLSGFTPSAKAWDHPGHMTTAGRLETEKPLLREEWMQ